MTPRLQIYLTAEAHAVIGELERMWKMSDPRNNPSRAISDLLVIEARKHRAWLDSIAEAAGPAQAIVRPRGRPRKDADGR